MEAWCLPDGAQSARTVGLVRRSIMRKQWTAVVLTLVASALAFAGNDPWTSKPYQQWDDKDIAKVLKISPWSHTEAVEMTWRALSVEDIQSGQTPGGQSGSSA